MKGLKKLLTGILAGAMALSMTFAAGTTMTAEAANNTITVNNAVKGETYKAYKMLDLVVDSNLTAYTYTVNNDWKAFFAEDNKSVWGTVLEKDGNYIKAKAGIGNETEWSSSSALSAFAEKAAAYAVNVNPADSKEADASGKVVLNTTSAGYYLITSTLGTRAMLDTTPGNVEINEKNEGDTVDKKVKEDNTGAFGENNDDQVGNVVEFKTETTVAARSINVKIHDTMDKGLTLDQDSIVIKDGNDNAIAGADKNFDAPYTFTVTIPDEFAATATGSQKVIITYSATINKNAIKTDENGSVIVDQNNKATVEYGNGTISEEKTTTTTTHKFAVYKHAYGKTENLAGAVFQLKKAGKVVKLYKIDDNNYRVADATETGEARSHANDGEVNEIATGLVSDFVTVASGNINILGVDADNDYSLAEIQAPKGFNLLANEVEVTVGKDNATVVNVENNTGTELPSTGGIGTTIFYIIGGLLIVAAVVFFVVRRRADAE